MLVEGLKATPDTTTTRESLKNMPGKETNPERSEMLGLMPQGN